METHQQILLFVIMAYAGGLTSAFSFNDWGGSAQQQGQPRQQQQPVRQPIMRTGTSGGKQWGRGNQAQPIVLPCDGSREITKACETFCESIGAQGACVIKEQTCGCTRRTSAGPAPQTSAGNSGPVSPQAPPKDGTGIHVVSAPDLTLTNSTPPVANDGQGMSPEVSSRTVRSRRGAEVGKIVESSPKDSAHTCSKDSCALTCRKQGYDKCAAECIGLSCFCRCPSLDKTPAPVQDPLKAVQEPTPEDEGMSGAFRPPV